VLSAAVDGLETDSRERLPRPALLGWLDRAFGVRLTTVTAAAGFGKTTLLGAWVAELQCAWHTVTAQDRAVDSLADAVLRALARAVPDLVAGLPVAAWGTRADGPGAELWSAVVCERMHAALTHDLVLVFDDVHELGEAGAAARLIESLCLQAPETLHVVLASRTAPPFPVESLRRRGEVLELSGDAFAFTVDEVAELLERAGVEANLAGRLHEATGGWPVAVGLLARGTAASAGRRGARAGACGLALPGGPAVHVPRARGVRPGAGWGARAAPAHRSARALPRGALGGSRSAGDRRGTGRAAAPRARGALGRRIAVPARTPAGLRRRQLAARPSRGARPAAARRRVAQQPWRHIDALSHLAAAGDSAQLARLLSRYGPSWSGADARPRPRGGGRTSTRVP
jgi:hypothetical protein